MLFITSFLLLAFSFIFMIFSVKIQVADLKSFLFYISICYPLSPALSVSHIVTLWLYFI